METNRETRYKTHTRQIERYQRKLAYFSQIDRRFSRLRLGAVLLGGGLSLLGFQLGPPWVGLGLAGLAIAVFAYTVSLHRRLDQIILKFQISMRTCESQSARMKLDWEAIPRPVEVTADPYHPFQRDLDLTGWRSLHQLVDTAQSHGGSKLLRTWLLCRSLNRIEINKRQELVKEIEPLSGFRHRLTLHGALAYRQASPATWDGGALSRWLAKHTVTGSFRPILIFLSLLGLVNLVLLGLNFAGLVPPYWIGTGALYGLVYVSYYSRTRDLFDQAYQLGSILRPLTAVSSYLERYPYAPGSRLSDLCSPFRNREKRPSRFLHQIGWIASAASLQHNQFVWLILNAAVPWDFYFGYLLERFKESIKVLLPGWLETWYELEAVNSLANFAYLNPGFVYPEVVDGSNEAAGTLLEAEDLGHPLIQSEKRVGNDFSIENLGEIIIVTGSNMSGKSTFLRTLGVNLSLAYGGGPICGRHLRVVPLRLFTCIQVEDSVSDGISYFYAEVRRLKALLAELQNEHPNPLFFLIDEIFRGTNNRERQIGARAYLRALAHGRGSGVVSTHDLELARLAEVLPGIRNCHFRESVRDGRMIFDYRLREGPSPTTNALEIMRMEGLPVHPDSNSTSDDQDAEDGLS